MEIAPPDALEGEDPHKISISLKYKSDQECLASHSIRVIGTLSSGDHETYELGRLTTSIPRKFIPGSETVWSTTSTNGIDGPDATEDKKQQQYSMLVVEAQIIIFGDRESIFKISPFPSLVQPPCLGDDLLKLVTDTPAALTPTYSDITLVSASAKFHCHKVILSARSSTLRKKFTSRYFGMRLLLSQGEYIVDGIEPEVLRELIVYIYSDKCR